MKTFIKAKYYGPSNTKGSRIKISVIGEKGFRWIGYDHAIGSVAMQVEQECKATHLFTDEDHNHFFQEGTNDRAEVVEEVVELIGQLQCPLFASRSTINEAHEYVTQIATANGGHTTPAVVAAYVLQNTISKELIETIRGELA
jgi:hypothetical protein